MPVAAVAAATVVAGYMASKAQSDAGEDAANAQRDAASMQVVEQRRQFEAIQKLLKPYVSAGTGAIGGQQDLLGLSGPEAQKAAIDALQNSPQFTALTQQGENAMLQNASATGGLRGGNLQGALAQFRPQVLSGLIQQQFGNLGSLSQLGQASAAGQAAAGQNMANQIGNAYGQMGAANAGSALATGRGNAQMWNTTGQAAGNLIGAWGSNNNMAGNSSLYGAGHNPNR